jgi:hypothetical protein
MSNNEIVKINPNNSLVKVSNLISLTKKLLDGINKRGIVLYNLSEYNLQRKTELAFIVFIKKNIWLFLPQIIDKIKNKKLSTNPYPLDFIMIIEKHDLNYEYPQSFYLTRKSEKVVDKDYRDSRIKEYIDEPFKNMAFENVTCFIAGTIITEYADTSIGLVLGLKYKWTHND